MKALKRARSLDSYEVQCSWHVQNGHRHEVLVVDIDHASLLCVPLPEDICEDLQLYTTLDEVVQLDSIGQVSTETRGDKLDELRT